jgi:hypothetical protein
VCSVAAADSRARERDACPQEPLQAQLAAPARGQQIVGGARAPARETAGLKPHERRPRGRVIAAERPRHLVHARPRGEQREHEWA